MAWTGKHLASAGASDHAGPRVLLVMRKAFGAQAGIVAVVINELAITGMLLLPGFAPGIIFPVIGVLEPRPLWDALVDHCQ